MESHRFTITKVTEGIFTENFLIEGTGKPLDLQYAFGGHHNWSVRRELLRGGPSDRVDLIHVDNGKLNFTVVPTRGMGIWKGTLGAISLGWNSPVAPVIHPAFVNQSDLGGLGWLQGFNEWICRCGLNSNGPPCQDGPFQLTLHGHIANTPAHEVFVEVIPGPSGEIRVSGTVDERFLFGPNLRMVSTYSTGPNKATLKVQDQVTNLGGGLADLELLYHLNQGPPFLGEGSRLLAPVTKVIPRDQAACPNANSWDLYSGPKLGFPEEVYYLELKANEEGNTLVMLVNADRSLGLSLKIPQQQLPYFIQWKNTQAEADGYVTGLEPAINLPNIKTYERSHGRLIQLEPGETRTMSFEISVHQGKAEVEHVANLIKSIQGTDSPTIFTTPQPGYSPAGDA